MEYLLSAGIDIGTTTTHLVISRIGIAVERGWGTVPKAEIKEKTILYQSPIYFTPLADGQIDLPRVQTIIDRELEKAGTTPGADMSESDYTVVSNISRYGMAPVEAGAYIADVIQDLLQKGGK